MSNSAKFQARINQIGREYAERVIAQVLDYSPEIEQKMRPFMRQERNADPRLKKIIAYDLETTRIQKGTPSPLYVTAVGADFWVSSRLKNLLDFGRILRDTFLTAENKGARFIAWNGNKYDVYFVAAALLHDTQYVLRPYMTRSKNLRGLRVSLREDEKTSWEFLDGMAMTGIQKKLADFLKVFAPEHLKLDGPDWETETFDYKNQRHVAYAERDSEGLYHALVKAQGIILSNFNLGLQPTVGNLGIKILAAHLPDGVQCWAASSGTTAIIREYVMRGGFCFCQRKFQGPVWKYDINQAYAAAMRDAALPAGRCKRLGPMTAAKGLPAIYRVSGRHKKNIIPFYYRSIKSQKTRFDTREIEDTWITSIEYEQLLAEGWTLDIVDGHYWTERFDLAEYVGKLEQLRIHGPGGPKSAQGELIKAIGNNSYGKTVERLEGLELVMAAEKPEGYRHYQTEDEELQHIWFKINEPVVKDYHQPQLGSFITAHVRMVVRRAALLKPEAWLYADTDCVVFTEAVPLEVSSTEYGKWKVEAEGEEFRIIDKKVYASMATKIDEKTKQVVNTERHAKGMNVNRLTNADFENWFDGKSPEQNQVHRQNFVKAMTGKEMFVERKRQGSLRKNK